MILDIVVAICVALEYVPSSNADFLDFTPESEIRIELFWSNHQVKSVPTDQFNWTCESLGSGGAMTSRQPGYEVTKVVTKALMAETCTGTTD